MTQESEETNHLQPAFNRLMQHFGDQSLETLATVEKIFPTTVQPDIEGAIEALLPGAIFAGISARRGYDTLNFSILVNQRREPPVISAPEYLDIDIGEDRSGRCVAAGLWMFQIEGAPAALLLSQVGRMEQNPGVHVQVIASEAAGGRDEAQAILGALAKALSNRSVYRGKALSFETERRYMGGLGALRVQSLPRLEAKDVILPEATMQILDQTVFQFLKVRDTLRDKGFSTKRGLLLYGPPGTGKTHFIRYLLGQLEGHTSLLVAAEQVAYLNQIMGIAPRLAALHRRYRRCGPSGRCAR